MSSHSSDNNDKEGLSEAALFETIAHETRIRALFLLRDDGLSFSELKRELGISSSGNLQHHIGKLRSLIQVNGDGQYALTDSGKEALLAIQSIRTMQDRLRINLKALIVIATLSLYAIQMTVPFLLGTVDALTPLDALVGSVAFGVFMYIIWTACFKLIMDKKSESATWLKKEESFFLKD
ncbi:MAG: winged helix-turn-helix transcriptional regulator [Candidatus Thorarchaeota archaeon]|nr:winged helix-turn-helix transcriptional regulator [Candidatus Thorarchaeota archaeon]